MATRKRTSSTKRTTTKRTSSTGSRTSPTPATPATPAPKRTSSSSDRVDFPTLAEGARGAHVRQLQGLLFAAGQSAVAGSFNGAVFDGVYGEHTAEAVAAVQSAHELEPTGVADADVWVALLSDDDA